MCDLLVPAKPKEKSYQELVKLIQDHLARKPSEIVQRFKFNNHFRNEGESVRVPNKFFGIQDLAYFKAGIRDFKGKVGRDSRL